MRSVAVKGSKPQKVAASSGKFKPISETDLDLLMESDITSAVKDMGFSLDKIRLALRHKLEQTGMPFFSLEPCIEAVFQVTEEENRQSRQGDKMQALHNESQSGLDEVTTSSSNIASAGPSQTSEGASPSEAVGCPAESTTMTSTPTSSSASVEQSSNTTVNTAVSSAMEVDEEPSDHMESQDNSLSENPVSESENLPGTVVATQEAGERISAAYDVLKPVRSGPSSPETGSENGNKTENTEGQTTPIKKNSVSACHQSRKHLWSSVFLTKC